MNPLLHYVRPARATDDWFVQRLEDIGMFFDGTDRVHQTMRRVASKLESAGIAYVIVGGMAVNAHRHQRTTRDVDFLVSATGFEAFQRLVTAGEFDPTPGRPRRFVDRDNGVTFDLLVSGLFPGSGLPGPIAYPDPQAVAQRIGDLSVIDLVNLIQLKLAAGRYQDFGDVVNLIRANGLNESFQDRLHRSIRADFIECLEEMRREDRYEAIQDQALERKQRTPGPETKS